MLKYCKILQTLTYILKLIRFLMESENTNFPYEKSMNINSKGFLQIGMKAKSDQPIDNKKIVADFIDFKKQCEKTKITIQKEELKK